MMRVIALLFSLAVCVAAMGQEPASPEEKAVSAVLKLGGRVVRDEKLPGRPVIAVYLDHVTDSDLKDLKELKGLRMLGLSYTKITDAGLKDLKELRNLQTLNLGGTRITDAGLKELKELKGLRMLGLSDTKITDAGLKDLKELKGLQRLNLNNPHITDAGLEDLKQALPNLKIESLGSLARPAAPQAPPATADVRQRLREEIDLDFERTSLDNVLKYISEVQRGLNIVVDPAVAQAGIDLSKRVVDLKVKRAPVDEVLDLLLKPDLGYKIEAGRVLVTTRDRLPRDLSAVTYRLHEALLRPGGAEAPAAFLQAIKQLVNHRAESDIAAWREEGGTASLSLQSGALVITQTARGHERAAELLNKVGGVLDALAEMHDILLKTTEGSEKRALSLRECDRRLWTQYETGAVAGTRRRLREEIDLDFERTSLDNVLKYIGEVQRGLNIVVEPTLDHARIDLSKRMVTMHVKRVAVEQILDLLVKPDLGWEAEPGYVLITTRERSAGKMGLAVLALERYSPGKAWPGNAAEAAELPQLIKRVVNHATDPAVGVWTEDGGPAAIERVGGLLLVLQTARGHEQFANLLEQLNCVRRYLAEVSGMPPNVAQEYKRAVWAEPRAVAETRRRLHEEIDIDFERISLDNFLKYISDVKRGLNIVVDPALAQAGIDLSKRPVTWHAKGVPVENALAKILDKDLDFMVREGYVLVTTRQEAIARNLCPMAYPVQNLLNPAREKQAPGRQAKELLDRVRLAVNGKSNPRVAAWSDAGGPASLHYFAGLLVVVQTREGHQMVGDWLESAAARGAGSIGPPAQ